MSIRQGTWFRCLRIAPATIAATALLAACGAAAEGPAPGPRPAHRHAATPEMIEAVRGFVPPLANSSDEEIAAILQMMPPNYEWYLSESGLRRDTGVLVVTHGFSEAGDAIFSESLKPVAREYPTAVAYGMAMMTSAHIQDAVNDLASAGAKTVVVVPATQSEFDTGIRQYRFIVGDLDEPAYMKVPQVQAPVKFIVTPPVADHPLTTEILLDHAREISAQESNEVLIILGHGPADAEDNALELAVMQRHADRIKSTSDFVDVQVINLQDDAGPEVRGANVQALRGIVEAAKEAGHEVLVIGFLLGSAGIQPKIVVDLEGLDYRFNPRGMSENPRFAVWVGEMVRQAPQ